MVELVAQCRDKRTFKGFQGVEIERKCSRDFYADPMSPTSMRAAADNIADHEQKLEHSVTRLMDFNEQR